VLLFICFKCEGTSNHKGLTINKFRAVGVECHVSPARWRLHWFISVSKHVTFKQNKYKLRMGSEKQNSSSGITRLMKMDLLQEQSSGPIDSVKAETYMFLKILEQLQEIKMVLAELFDDLHDEMLFPAPLQPKSNEELVIVDRIVQTGNEAVNGVELFV
jgi:hypothetical protein